MNETAYLLPRGLRAGLADALLDTPVVCSDLFMVDSLKTRPDWTPVKGYTG